MNVHRNIKRMKKSELYAYIGTAISGIIILLIRNLAAVGIYLGLTWELIKRDRFPDRV